MENKSNIEVQSDNGCLVQRQNKQLSLVNNILANRRLSDLLFDMGRIRKAIDLTINACLHLDPFFDPFEMDELDKEALANEILKSFKTGIFDSLISPVYTFKLPKRENSFRIARYFKLKDYSIRYLITLILSEKITFSNSVFGGRKEIFIIDDGSSWDLEIERFRNIQNNTLLSQEFDYIVYIDIKKYYDNINFSILLDILKRKLSLKDDDLFIKIAKAYNSNITIGCWCDKFIQNIYFNDLDLVLNAHSWSYFRMTDDIRIFCKSKEEAELALEIVKSELLKLELSINEDKNFIIKPYTTLERFRLNRYDFEEPEFSPILDLKKIKVYPVENIFKIFHDSLSVHGDDSILIKYKREFPKKFTYWDELLSKTGFQVNGIDVKDIVDDFEQKQNLNLDDLKVLETIIFNTYNSYQFTTRSIRLFITNAFSQNDNKDVEILLLAVFKKLSSFSYTTSHGYDPGSSDFSYITYIFLRLIFLEPAIPNSYLIKFRKDIWQWFFEIIKHNKYNSSYLAVTVRYIIDRNLFRITHNVYGDLLKFDRLWYQEISKDKDINEGIINGGSWCYSNLIAFIEGMFPNSELLNKKRADYYYDHYEYNTALNYFLTLLSSSDISNLNFKIGYCYHHINNYENALYYYSEHLKLHNSAAAFNNRALIYQHLKQYDEALADFTASIKEKESAKFLENRAVCYIELSKFDNALFDLNRAIEEVKNLNDKSHTDIYKKRAKVKKELNDIQGAIEDIELYCKLSDLSDSAKLIKDLLEDRL